MGNQPSCPRRLAVPDPQMQDSLSSWSFTRDSSSSSLFAEAVGINLGGGGSSEKKVSKTSFFLGR